MRWPFARPHPDPLVRAYLDATPRHLRGKTPCDDLNFVVLDAEATGFDIGHDRMLSLATIPVRAGAMAVERSHAWLIRQPAAPVTSAVAVHGILPSESAQGTAEADVLRELLGHLAGAVIVGHHVHFDAALIDAALHRHLGARLRNPLLDTARLASTTLEAFRRTGYANQRPPRLEEVCADCGIEMMARHTAAGDAFTTAEIFLLLTARLRRRLGRPLRLGDLPVTRA
jgi:DNA polymerase III subunit epsilon